MAKRFLTHLDMSQNQILNAAFEKLSSDPTTGNFEGRIYYNTVSGLLKIYDGTQWITAGAITDVQGTSEEVEVSITDGVATIGLPSSITVDVSGNLTGNADTATTLATARTISLGGDLTGSASFDGSANITISATVDSVQANSVALGTDTTGDYVASISGGTGVTVTGGTGEGSTPSVAIGQDVATTATPTFAGLNVDYVTVGTAGLGTISTQLGNLTLDSAGGTVEVNDNLTITGDLTVSGTTTTVNTETINLADNVITLNSNATGTPTENAGIEVERGDSTNVVFRWNESSDVWEATTDGTNYATVLLSGVAASTDISDFSEAVQDVIGGILTDTSTVNFTYTDASDTIEAAVILASGGGLTDSSGVAVDYTTVEAQLVSDGFTKKVSANIGNGVATSYAISHNLGTRDVQVQVYDNSSYDTVECDVVRTDANTVTVSTTAAPTTDALRVVVVG